MESEDSIDEVFYWRGCSMDEIYRNLNKWELKHVPPVQLGNSHTVLYHIPIRNTAEPPRPLRQSEKWDSSHVRLPCSTQSQYPVGKSDGSVAIESRWQLIQKSLAHPIKNSKELELAILAYNSKYNKVWKFKALHRLFTEEATEEEAEAFFNNLLPKIIALALRLPELIMAPIPLLKQGQNKSISLSQLQISCLLANAFLCTFPRRNTMKRKSEYSSFPDINFSRLFQSSGPQVIEKIRCICHYFRRVCNTVPLGVMTFTRRALTDKDVPKWDECTAPLGATPLHVSSAGTIEDQGQGLLQVDFANKYLGGGVLGSGCVQEEIRFVICPELLVSKLFTEALRPHEALIMVGCEQYSKYTGYASTFNWDGDFIDFTPMDESRRRQCNVVAIDALHFVQSSHQYRDELILRELNKAYVGFIHPLDTPAPGVASGNWGCGAFGGEATLKALIQLMACTITKRPLVYFTFGNTELRDAIHDIHTFFLENNVTVKELWSYLKEFKNHNLAPNDLYAFICQIHCDKKQDVKQNTNRSQTTQKVIASKIVPNKGSIRNMLTTNTSRAENLQETVEKEKIDRMAKDLLVVNIQDVKSKDENNSKSKLNANNDACSIKSSLDRANDADAMGEDNNAGPSSLTLPSESTEPEANAGARFRQRSLLEMLDCFYNKDPKRLRTS